MIAHLVQSYGYYAVFALIALESLGIPLPGESALIAAALYAGTTHHLNIAALAAVAASATVIGDNAGYWGRQDRRPDCDSNSNPRCRVSLPNTACLRGRSAETRLAQNGQFLG